MGFEKMISLRARLFAVAWIAMAAQPLVMQELHAQISKTAKSPAPGTLWLYPERIALQDGGFAVAERGILFVPANRKKPDSEIIGIEIYRFRAAPTANAATPPIFRLHGGPSFQGFEGALNNRGFYEREVQPYLEVADFVVIGQRGIGSSKPNTLCERPAAVPITATDEQSAAAELAAARRCMEFWQQWGLDLSGLTVVEAAADLNDARAALGYDKVQIRGGSFGSHWGMATMRLYPQIVTRAVLRGLEGPDHTYDPPSGVLNALARIAAAADTATALRGHIPPGGLLKALRDVIARLDKEPAIVTVADASGQSQNVRVDGNAVRAIAYGGAARAWPARVIDLHRGDYTAAATALIRSRQQPGYQTASYYMLDCGSGITAERAARYRTDTAAAVLGDINKSYNVNCQAWPSDLGNEFRQYFETNIPTVFVQGDWDVSTPIENARELQPYFKNMKFVLVKGGSHGAQQEALAVSPLYRKEILEFYATGDMSGIPVEVVLRPVQWVVPGTATAPN